MISRVYRIKFNQTLEELDNQYDKLSDIEQQRIEELDAISYFDYIDIESDSYIFYVIAYPSEIKSYFDILKTNLINFEASDISDDILYNKVDLESYLKPRIYKNDTIKFDFFTEDLKYWIEENLNIDIILDRISEVGINNLTKIESDFLKKYKH